MTLLPTSLLSFAAGDHFHSLSNWFGCFIHALFSGYRIFNQSWFALLRDFLLNISLSNCLLLYIYKYISYLLLNDGKIRVWVRNCFYKHHSIRDSFEGNALLPPLINKLVTSILVAARPALFEKLHILVGALAVLARPVTSRHGLIIRTRTLLPKTRCLPPWILRHIPT